MTVPKDLDEKIPIKIIPIHKNQIRENKRKFPCAHPYRLIKDGVNRLKDGNEQRYKCNVCGFRFGNETNVRVFNDYMIKTKEILYDLLIMDGLLSKVAEKYGIPQPKLSTFKKWAIRQIYSQNKEKLEHPIRRLPRGVMFADETFMGKKGSSNSEVVFLNIGSEYLAAGPVQRKNLFKYIQNVFNGICESARKGLRVFITDGEPAYKKLAKSIGNIIHVQQLHGHKKLGILLINKYERLGAHWLEYQIKTNWNAFGSGKQELEFDWSIKLKRGRMYLRRGRPSLHHVRQAWKQFYGNQWRQKEKKYQKYSTERLGSAKIFVNPDTNMVSLRACSHKWMIDLMRPLLKIFNGKHATTNKMEGNHSHVKGSRKIRKQPDPIYQHQEYALQSYILEHGHLPPATLRGKYLWKYLTKPERIKGKAYDVVSNGRHFVQSSLTAFAMP